MPRIVSLVWICAVACGPVPPGAGSGSESPVPAAEDLEQMARNEPPVLAPVLLDLSQVE